MLQGRGMKRPFQTFLGIDLGGGKGKNTAVARLETAEDGRVEVAFVDTQAASGEPWYDTNLIDYIGLRSAGAVIAIDAPLTLPACVRCREEICPGMTDCVDPTIVWVREVGAQLVAESEAGRDEIAAVPAGRPIGRAGAAPRNGKPHTTPYTQRATEVVLHRRHGIQPRETLGQGMGPLTARAAHLVKALRRIGFKQHENLIEVYPKATIAQLWSPRTAQQYRRDTEAHDTRMKMLASLRGRLEFGAGTRFAKQKCVDNDHCFDAVVAAYTAYLWAHEGWTLPEDHRDVYEVDGWIWAPGIN